MLFIWKMTRTVNLLCQDTKFIHMWPVKLEMKKSSHMWLAKPEILQSD